MTPIDLATKTAGTPIAAGKGPQAIAITPDGKTAYVSAEGAITPINLSSNTAGTPLHVSGTASVIAIVP